MKIQMTVKVVAGLLMVLACSSMFAQMKAVDVFTDWPRGAEPEVVSRRLTDLFLTTPPEAYKPVGYVRMAGGSNAGYGDKGHIHYSTVAIWINAMECARLVGDTEREAKLIAAFEPFFGVKADHLPKFKHVDFTIVGAVPLEIAILNGDKRARELGLKYADMQWEEPKQDDPPPLYNVMSYEERMKWWKQGYSDQTRLWIDDMYMITVLQGQAYRLTKNRAYIDRAAREMCLYLDEIQLKDGPDAGLFYHAPDVPFVWGRGDGWMAAGMPLLLEMLPADSEHRAKILDGYRTMMAKLLERQCSDGMWNQLVGDPKSWKETSCTAMFGYAFAMGVKNGWLDAATYGVAARKAWLALVNRLDAFGNVPDVCCGTGKKNDYQYYLDRPRIHGDPHGQAPLLWMARAFLETQDQVLAGARHMGDADKGEPVLVNRPAKGFRGIWYFNQPSKDEYVYKYSGGMGTYCMGHVPFAVYRKEVDKTFFCFGGTDDANSTLLYCVSYFDHKTKKLARPTIVYDKHATDAHDNAVLNMDADGHLYLFGGSHGKWRPSVVARSKRPYDISEFEEIRRDNFSYPQPWFVPGKGFLFLNTLYQAKGRGLGRRADFFQTSADGRTWTASQMLHFINEGDYQRSWQAPDGRVGLAFDQHPKGKGLNWRTDLYYMETRDFGQTWTTAAGEPLKLPLKERQNPALAVPYAEKGKNVYINTMKFDSQNRPIIVYIVSKGYRAGPKDGPREWKIARWTGTEWKVFDTGIKSANNYDFCTLYLDSDQDLRLIGASAPGPQLYNPGGEIQSWVSHDGGATWSFEKSLTQGSARNHNYPRQPLNVHPDFYAFWADGNGRRPSVSRLYFCDRDLNVYRMPLIFEGPFATPER